MNILHVSFIVSSMIKCCVLPKLVNTTTLCLHMPSSPSPALCFKFETLSTYYWYSKTTTNLDLFDCHYTGLSYNFCFFSCIYVTLMISFFSLSDEHYHSVLIKWNFTFITLQYLVKICTPLARLHPCVIVARAKCTILAQGWRIVYIYISQDHATACTRYSRIYIIIIIIIIIIPPVSK